MTTQPPNSDDPTCRALCYPLSIAPMMDRTDRHFRYFMRQITTHSLLYTEMIPSGAILHGDRERHLAYSEIEHPIALQLGGSDPEELSQCAVIAEDMGYDEVNINVGCPSPRVKKGQFGASLMAIPQRVADCVDAMRQRVNVPVTVKHRIGIDDLDRYEDMHNFVSIVAKSGCDRFTVHARKAWLNGLSPKQNRTVPPLRYSEVHRLKREFPTLQIEINGGLKTLKEVSDQLEHVDAVMIGRAAYDNPFFLAEADQRLFGATHEVPSRGDVIEGLLHYAEEMIARGEPLFHLLRHLHHLYFGLPGSRAWRRFLGEEGARPDAGLHTLEKARRATQNAGSEPIYSKALA